MSTGQLNQKMTLMLPLLNREHRIETNGCSGRRESFGLQSRRSQRKWGRGLRS